MGWWSAAPAADIPVLRWEKLGVFTPGIEDGAVMTSGLVAGEVMSGGLEAGQVEVVRT